MIKTVFGVLAVSILTLTAPASAAEAAPNKAAPQFLGIDLDNGSVYYNGRNSGLYCVYKTIRVYNGATGYLERRRARRCGRGLYLS
jgi:hypothetical protein